MYYPADSLKARLCVKGRRLLYELCPEHNIPHRKIGKVIVASDKKETAGLEKIFALGKNNGVEGLRIIDRDELRRLEPNIRGHAALYSPETGIIDSHRLMQFFLDKAKDNGAIAAFDSEVVAIGKMPGGYKVSIKNNADISDLCARVVINCAGLDSDGIAAMAGIDIGKYGYGLHYCKGQYFRLAGNKARLINGLVYPVPQPASGGLGIHVTVDLAGEVRLGPDDEFMPANRKDYSVDATRRRDFHASAAQFMPFLEEEDLAPDIAGIRPKLQSPGGVFRDFVIREESDKGFSNFINLIGIESPGLTASCAIADHVAALIPPR
jgi:L-2-hydroxyglutarate oxidase LhgO